MKIDNLIHIVAGLLIANFIASCAAPDKQHQVVISTREQKLVVLEQGKLVATYPVSTSKFCLGDRPGSYGTPLGKLEIAAKIVDAPLVSAIPGLASASSLDPAQNRGTLVIR